eukprot:g8338.t1
MKIVVPKETHSGERRVSATPEVVKKWTAMGAHVFIEKGAGENALFPDSSYLEAGGSVDEIDKISKGADLVLCVRPPEPKRIQTYVPDGATLIGQLGGREEGNALFSTFKTKNLRGFSLELLPRITRAQSMDILSSQNNLAGYQAVLEAAILGNRVFPMMTTAAGSIPPVRVFVLGAGVAGLQAIATAKRMGAIVTAFDVRPETREQAIGLGAQFLDVPQEGETETSGGYAKESSEESRKLQTQKMMEVLPRMDVVICTALVFGRKAPILLTKEMVKIMKKGSVVIDLASEAGGNCELTKDGVCHNIEGVSILGDSHLAVKVAHDASALYAKNLFAFSQLLWDKGEKGLTWKKTLDDELLEATCVTDQHLG